MARILLLGANEREAAGLDESLRGHDGWEVVRAATVLDAIRVAGESRFDAAVLDTDLPDGSGLDILDYLRLGSPGIRIVLLAAAPDERVAFHALSHGAGDLIVKGHHVDIELPRRLRELLDAPSAEVSLVATLAAARAYEPPTAAVPRPKPTDTDRLESVIDRLVEGQVRAAGVWDVRGSPVVVKAPMEADAAGIGFAIATIHGQVGALYTYGDLKPTGYRLLVDVEGGLIAVTAVPGTYLVAILVDGEVSPTTALDQLDEAALCVLAALQGGPPGHDTS